MVGFITERHLDQAEEAFPGIARFFASLARKPRTFLELVSLFAWGEGGFAGAAPSRGGMGPSEGPIPIEGWRQPPQRQLEAA
jgi:hypothetical protein